MKYALPLGGEMQNRIAELRSSQGLTQQGLADEIGVSRQTIISLELGAITLRFS